MRRLVHIATLGTTVLVTAGVALAVATSTSPPRVESISSVVTGRPVRELEAAPSAVATESTTVVAETPAMPPAPVRTVVSTFMSAARKQARRTASKPTVPPIVSVSTQTESDSDADSDDDDDDHEVVKPDVRDDIDSDSGERERGQRHRETDDESNE